MTPKPPDDPRITDLARFKKARQAQLRRNLAKPRGPDFLGSNPRAALILALVMAVGPDAAGCSHNRSGL